MGRKLRQAIREEAAFQGCAFLWDTPKLELPIDDDDDSPRRDGDHESF